jgi:hypothetical protein
MLKTGHIKVGMRVLVFDSRLYVDDVKTPASVTFRPATVLRVYDHKGDEVADVRFDHDLRESKAHFTHGIRPL